MPGIGATLFALGSACAYGAGDFVGGRAATRLPTLTVLLIAQLGASALAVAVAWRVGNGPVLPSAALLGAIGGLCHVAAVGCLYHGLAHGRITIVAPVSGVLNIALPALVDGLAVHGLGMLQAAGILLAGVAVCMITKGVAEADRRSATPVLSIGLGVASGLLFGASDLAVGSVAVDQTSGAVMAARLIGTMGVAVTVLIVFARRLTVICLRRLLPAQALVAAHRRPALDRSQLTAGIAMALSAGLLDCGGHLAYAESAALGELSSAVAVTAMFPAVSVLLAIVVLKERIGRLQSLGLGVSAGAVVMLAGA
ncbi:MAG: hypothetical protein R3D57_15675 [Hyphomicrobiaceae bacterium]